MSFPTGNSVDLIDGNNEWCFVRALRISMHSKVCASNPLRDPRQELQYRQRFRLCASNS